MLTEDQKIAVTLISRLAEEIPKISKFREVNELATEIQTQADDLLKEEERAAEAFSYVIFAGRDS